jgi:hypothetical protein
MNHESTIDTNQRNGNLHISLSGVFSLDTARQLTTLISRNYPGRGYVFIHTGRLTRVEPLCKVLFSNLLLVPDLPREKIYLTGDKARELCYDEARLVSGEPDQAAGCNGGCTDCVCRGGYVH